MQKLILLLLTATMVYSCKPTNNNTSNGSTVSYANACCCNTIFTAGIGQVFIPSLFTPNADGINDVLYIGVDSNIKYVTNCVIKDSLGVVITTIDTVKQGKYWDGFYNNGNFYRGVCKVSCEVTDKANTVTVINTTTSVFTCDSSINQIPNATNCKLPDQFNPVSVQTFYTTNEPCF